jgi:hypothetical protein
MAKSLVILNVTQNTGIKQQPRCGIRNYAGPLTVKKYLLDLQLMTDVAHKQIVPTPKVNMTCLMSNRYNEQKKVC